MSPPQGISVNICIEKRHPVQEYFICFYTAAVIVAAGVLEGDCGPDLIGVSDLYIVHLAVDGVEISHVQADEVPVRMSLTRLVLLRTKNLSLLPWL